MIDDWRYDDGKMRERQIALTCFIHEGYEINRSVYEFCHYFVSNGLWGDTLPQTAEEASAILKESGIYKYAGRKLFEEYSAWRKVNEERPVYKEGGQEDHQDSEEAS
jgi:hypothetical protein